MKITFFGVRGTSPVIGAQYSEYGGETTCILIEGEQGEKIIIDAGTGLRNLGKKLIKENSDPKALLLMTHYHLDHVSGLPSFSPLYDGNWRLIAAAPVMNNQTVDQVLERLFAEPFWPLQVDTLPARVEFITLPGEISKSPFQYGGLEINWTSLHHPGGATAYRIDEPKTGNSFIFATDVEWEESTPEEKEVFISICTNPVPADLLVFDGQYCGINYKKYRGWGHTAWQAAVEVSRLVKAGRLLITHHDPDNDDKKLKEIENQLKKERPESALARDGMQIIF